uniref:Polyprenol dehydrogenase n=1 Tax=Sus scrofa TaxID=9823 RepID=A0A8D1E0V7_PIG
GGCSQLPEAVLRVLAPGLLTARQLMSSRPAGESPAESACKRDCYRMKSRHGVTSRHLCHMLLTRVEFLYCDLASMKSIRQFVQKFKMKKIPLHVLVNNAGVMMVPQRETEDGFEEHFGVNYLGHFLLTHLLLDDLQASGSPGRSSRVVTVSSATHYVGELDLDDLQSRWVGGYSPHGAYARSKLALVLFSHRLQALLAAKGSPVTANVADPGVVNTDLYRHVFWGTRLLKKLFGWWFFKTPDEGAWTSVYAAVSPALEGVGGRYLYNEKEAKSLAITYDPKLQRQLWARSCQMTGIADMSRDTLWG